MIETGYSNIKRESLSVVFGLERLHHFVFDRKNKVQTGHKSLIPILSKSSGAVNSLLQCLLLRLAKYDIQLTYLKGKDNVISNALNPVSPQEPEPEDKDNFDVIPVYHNKPDILATGP